MFGYKDVAEYYADASSAYRLKAVKTPLLCLNAMDDPFAPVSGIPMQLFSSCSNAMMVLTRQGTKNVRTSCGSGCFCLILFIIGTQMLLLFCSLLFSFFSCINMRYCYRTITIAASVLLLLLFLFYDSFSVIC